MKKIKLLLSFFVLSIILSSCSMFQVHERCDAYTKIKVEKRDKNS